MNVKTELRKIKYGLIIIRKAAAIKKYHLLKPGQYRIWQSEKPVVYHTAYADFCHHFPKCGSNKFLDRLSFCFRQARGGTAFGGQAVLFAQNGEYKVFDLERSVVLTCLPEEKKRLICDNIRHFRGCLDMTVVGEDERGIIEKYIPYRNRGIWSEDELKAAYLKILDDQIRLTRQAKKEGAGSGRSILKEIMEYGIPEINGLCRRIEKNIRCDMDIPFIWQHGDVHFGNVLFCGDAHFYIDFEYARIESFLYDLFNCIYVEMTDNDSLILADFCLSQQGEIADRYQAVFENVGMTYHRQFCKDYFMLFLLSRIRFDVGNAFRRFTENKRKKYFDLLARKYSGVIGYWEAV